MIKYTCIERGVDRLAQDDCRRRNRSWRADVKLASAKVWQVPHTRIGRSNVRDLAELLSTQKQAISWETILLPKPKI